MTLVVLAAFAIECCFEGVRRQRVADNRRESATRSRIHARREVEADRRHPVLICKRNEHEMIATLNAARRVAAARPRDARGSTVGENGARLRTACWRGGGGGRRRHDRKLADKRLIAVARPIVVGVALLDCRERRLYCETENCCHVEACRQRRLKARTKFESLTGKKNRRLCECSAA